MAAKHAGKIVCIARVGEDIVLSITEDNERYVLSEEGAHLLHAGCHLVLDHKCGAAIVDLSGARKR